jgi:aldehyde dehydrogenase (NAD+)
MRPEDQSVETDIRGRSQQALAPDPYEDFEQLYIGGVWREGRSGRRGRDLNPWTGETLLELALANEADLDEAYRTAERTQRSWAAALPQERAQVLLRAAQLLARRKEEICEWLVNESGSTQIKAEIEWAWVHAGMLEAASYPTRVAGRILPSRIPGKENRVYREAIGVVGVISPWNFPLELSNRAVSPALALGNAVVLKPASETPVTGGLLFAKIFEEAGLPPGVLSVVVGSGSELGDAFVKHPVPRVISFTGSTPVGRHIGELAGGAIKKVCLELGGNSPFVVLDDADLDRAVEAAIAGKFFHQGQICMAINRIIVDARCHDDFVERFLKRARALKAGDPRDPKTAIGPLIHRKQLERLQKLIADTLARGAVLALGGQPQGLVMPPVVLTGVTNDMPAAQQELFGPVAPILRVHGEEEALRVANDTEFGLSSAVFSHDLGRGVRFARQIRAGMTHVNDMPVNDEPNTAFGGEKASGLGRFGGEWAMEEFTTDHWVSVQVVPREYPI